MTVTIGEPQVVDAGRGAAWWGEGFRLFTASFWTWIGIMVIYIVISMLVNAVPYVGTLGHWLLTPVFMGGLMMGCAALDRGEPLRVAHLFEGFQGAHFVPLMIIGAVNIALTLAIGAIAAVGVHGQHEARGHGPPGRGKRSAGRAARLRAEHHRHRPADDAGRPGDRLRVRDAQLVRACARGAARRDGGRRDEGELHCRACGTGCRSWSTG